MTVDAALTGARFGARATLDGLPLAPFVPALRGAQASLRADIQGGPGTALSGNLSALRLALPGATLTGTATLHDGIRAALQASADLSARPLPPSGRASVTAASRATSPHNLERWIEDPHATLAATDMPDMGVTPTDARNIAAYLYTLH